MELPKRLRKLTRRKESSVEALFGKSLPVLGDLVDLRIALGLKGGIPEPIYELFEYLKKYGIQEEGIFRIVGSTILVKELRYKINKGRAIGKFLGPDQSPHNIASLLKCYLRELPEPLLTFELYDCFMAAEAINFEQTRLECIKKIIGFLPRVNMIILNHLLELFDLIIRNYESTKMDAKNLSIVFGPTLLRAPPNSNIDLFIDANNASRLIEKIIINRSYLLSDQINLTTGKINRPVPNQENRKPFNENLEIDDEDVFGYHNRNHFSRKTLTAITPNHNLDNIPKRTTSEGKLHRSKAILNKNRSKVQPLDTNKIDLGALMKFQLHAFYLILGSALAQVCDQTQYFDLYELRCSNCPLNSLQGMFVCIVNPGFPFHHEYVNAIQPPSWWMLMWLGIGWGRFLAYLVPPMPIHRLINPNA
ncbi:RhoGAP-domain-containing protein [Rozella allomycis CSF55]|uniref:Rho GTPase-activating protein domain-containing protein n=1 Tax=Rozella allomycis (strain CSF55) TaxID=988480 RepID=A0A075AQK1_ROZAC|nr:Rho GTPase-activating protein domain-containing protein [Rozella allomycis CSF55]RKP21911.1 RhoGAP-domain-containing protein [Rozella allomycis CSF55]|eukprot:EPZ30985.1 Rho GTPase-activating protein domain-containing protein [Rozella allomycis CSF55]